MPRAPLASLGMCLIMCLVGGGGVSRGQGEGSITWDKTNEVWVVRIELPKVWDESAQKWRRKVRKATSKNKKLAMQKLVKMQREVEQGNLGTRNTTVQAWVDYWIANIAPKRVNPNSLDSYRSTLKMVTARFGDKPIGHLTPQRIREFTAEVAASKSPGTARNLHGYLSRCLRDAVGDGLLTSHPMEHLSIPRRAKAVENALSVDDAVKLLKWLGKQIDEQGPHAHLAPLWIAYLLTGARRGELIGLEAGRVGDNLDVTWQLQRLNPKDAANTSADYEMRHLTRNLYLVRPKSKAGWRLYPLVEPLKSMMRGLAADLPEDALVFRRPDGEPWQPDGITYRWRKMLIAAGIESESTPAEERVKLHGARHTVVDLLYMLDVPEHVISDIVGHSSRQVSRGYRTQQSPAVKDAMTAVANVLTGGQSQLPQ